MRNLIVFIVKYHFFFLFILIEIFCGYLIIQNNRFQRAIFINSTNVIAANLLETVNNFKEYFSLKRTNIILAKENAQLRSLVGGYHDSLSTFTVNDTLYKQQYKYIEAKVINNSINKRNNYLTLNKGSLHGIKSEMGVITSNGVVGIVKDVSSNYCSVISLLHKDSKLSVKIATNNYFGSLVWNGEDPKIATLLSIASHVKLSKGDTVVTSPYSTIFPEGIMVGVIDSFETGDTFYTIYVKLSVSFQNITYVYIINNLMREEQKKLEERAQHDS